MNLLLFYSSIRSNRLHYITRLFFEQNFGLKLIRCDDPEEFRSSRHPKINYSNQEDLGGLQIIPSALLSDYGIRDYNVTVQQHPRFHRIFFRNAGTQVPFDLLGAAFWLLCRYEEYLPHKGDRFNRFHFKSSLAWQHGFLELPLVNLWLNELRLILMQAFPDLQLKKRAYNFVSTIDIDNAWKYRYKGLMRSAAGILADLLKRDLLAVKDRLLIVTKRKADPFDCYDFLIDTHAQTGTEGIYFFLLGDYGVNDKNHSATNLKFQSLIKKLSDYSSAGIHPSYGSSGNIRQLKVEISRLANITHRQIFRSRQHFSILRFPETYSNLIQAGIHEDYSMGYTNINGFRASYCFPYNWYNIQNEESTPLMIHPFALTENTIEFMMQKQKSSFEDLVLPVITEVKRYGGELIPVFHNNNFSDNMKRNYLRFLELAK